MVERLEARLGLPLPGLEAQLRMAPRPRLQWNPSADPPLRDAAGLVLLYPHDDHVWLPLTVRASTLPHHTGQVSLPGGRLHAHESVAQAALREAEEEVGIAGANVRVLGTLTPLPIPVSGHLLHPVVGFVDRRPVFNVSAGEVERLLETPLAHLSSAGAVHWEQRRSRGPEGTMEVPYFDVDGARVWGATAMVLAELLTLVEEVT
jgi:8-oxo-dGTP pyrophosphatase MutT (NUDIX family)